MDDVIKNPTREQIRDELEAELPDWFRARYQFKREYLDEYMSYDYWTYEEAAAIVLGFLPCSIREYFKADYLLIAEENRQELIKALGKERFSLWIGINNVFKFSGYLSVKANFRRHWDYQGKKYLTPMEWLQRALVLKIKLPDCLDKWLTDHQENTSGREREANSWTSKELKKMSKSYAELGSYEKVAKEYGISRQRVSELLKRYQEGGAASKKKSPFDALAAWGKK